MIALVISCNWKRANHNEPKIEKVTIEPDSQISLQNQFDSNYFENMKRIAKNPYSSFYDTSLNGGYSISFCNDKEMQYLLYKKGDTKDAIKLAEEAKKLAEEAKEDRWIGYIGDTLEEWKK